ncbi:hypothetical protein GD1_129 [Paraglaciecola Antarctic GD virus 1]|nr:hypothetical protein GD1_129 [Paraglaciecola Antarctic GD virus 1]
MIVLLIHILSFIVNGIGAAFIIHTGENYNLIIANVIFMIINMTYIKSAQQPSKGNKKS